MAGGLGFELGELVLVGMLAMGITLSPWSLLALLALSSPR